MTIAEKQKKLVEEFEQYTDWEERYKHLIELGRQMPEMSEELKIDKYKLDGCQSQVWIKAELKDGKIYFVADSDAAIVKGLIALLLKVYSGHTPDEILSNPPEFLKQIGIDKHLSPTRKNGLAAMMKQIQMYAVAFKTLAGKK
ncbi:putative SufE Fe/S-cluster-related protein [Melioribacter roseus P3M-2]|uniref:Putative SufE Fe/S-cluster-related protein n=1 Tax=Melioribacter roseus (strain DSM 23840 / JCM 17771 / VKM B-2668 / P3M-2) TaxID=1191523 RepID=I6ZZP3_MELRP|nr:SufE family protein [Melioribacter roseus]AFN74438.1 putative SufE Fe/S-cluster-related protein [Melioribacter roseus P3M-2]